MRALVLLPRHPLDPELRIGGLSLPERCRRALEKAGASQVTIACSAPAGQLLPDERATLVAQSETVASPSVYEAMVARGRPGAAVIDGERIGVAVVDASTTDADALPAVEVPGWHVIVRAPADAERALERLLADCRKPVDGWVSRHLNRPLSLALTRRLAGLRWLSPNALTAVTFAVAVAGAAWAVRGDYLSTVVAAAAMHGASVLDGVDGELSRLRHEQSRLGAWLDTLGDDTSNVLFWTALAMGADTAGLPYVVAGVVTAGSNALVAAQNWAMLVHVGSGDLYALETPARHRLARFVAPLLKQDFFLLLTLLLALAGVLHQALPLFAAGGLITLAATTRRSLRLLRSRGSTT